MITSPDVLDHFDKASQHLLRHIDDPTVLRVNPLFASLCTSDANHADDPNRALGVLRDLLEQVCLQLAAQVRGHPRDSSLYRQYEIFRRCDINREPHAAVIADLAISRRQFYRERRLVARRVADSIVHVTRRPAPYSTDCSKSSIQVQVGTANRLLTAGGVQEAEKLLRRLLPNASSTSDVVAVTLPLVRLLCHLVRYEEAEVCITQTLRRVAQDASLPSEERCEHTLLLETEFSDVLLFTGRLERSLEMDALIERELPPALDGANNACRYLLFSVHSRLARRALHRNDSAAARKYVQRARVNLRLAGQATEYERIAFLSLCAQIDLLSGAPDTAETGFTECLDLATKHGLPKWALEGQIGMAIVWATRGEPSRARPYLESSFAILKLMNLRYMAFAIAVWIAQVDAALDRAQAPPELVQLLAHPSGRFEFCVLWNFCSRLPDVLT